MFCRTSSGLAAYHLFFRCDFVVLVEGSQQVLKDEAGDGGDDTADTMFWQRVFLAVGFTRSCHFKSVGGKPTLLACARDIAQDNITTVIVCMDRDFDHLTQRILIYPLVLYTRGYSWENDVFDSLVMRRQIERNCTNNQRTAKDCDDIISAYQRFVEQTHPYVAWDATLFVKGTSLFPRDGSLRPVVAGKGQVPELDHAFLDGRLQQIQSECGYVCEETFCVDTRLDLYGHCLAKAAYHFFVFCLQKLGKKYKVDFDHFVATSIHEFGVALQQGSLSDVHSYYSKRLTGVEALRC